MKKILVLTSTFPRYTNDSTAPFVYELSRELAKFTPIIVLAPFFIGTKLYEKENMLEIYRYRYWFDSKKLLTNGAILPNLKTNPLLYFQVFPFLIMQLITLARHMSLDEINIVHAHWIIPQGLIAVIYKKLWRANFRLILTSHGADIFGLQSPLLLWIKKWVINNADYVTVVNSTMKNKILELGVKQTIPVKVIPMGVNTCVFSPRSHDALLKQQLIGHGPFLLYVGRLTEKKGVEYLIKSMSTVIRRFPQAKLVIIGDGEIRGKLESLASLSKATKHIVFLGSIAHNELPRYFATADLFISPSIVAQNGDREGLPVTFIEALACGCPIITTNLPGNTDIIINGENGYLVHLKNSKDLADKIIVALSSTNHFDKKHIINTARRKYSWGKIGTKYHAILS